MRLKNRVLNFILSFRYTFYTYLWLPTLGRWTLKEFMINRIDRGYPLCIECGLCCLGCKAWDRNTRHCKIWEHTQTFGCKDFPYHPGAIKPIAREVCRYRWEPEDPIPSKEEVMKKLEEIHKVVNNE